MIDWPRTADEALAVQDELRARVEPGPLPAYPSAVAGLDVAYHPDGDRLAAAVVVLDVATHAVLDTAVVLGRPAFAYVPGLFAFRELPALLAAVDKLTVRPEVLVCDGHGLAHPRRFGLACHIGVLTGLPAFGVGKTPLVGRWDTPGDRRGDASPLLDAPWAGDAPGHRTAAVDGTEVLGAVLRTRAGVKPVFVSTGHRIGLDEAVALTLALTPAYRLPETTRAADQACRAALASAVRSG
jgi:deoxyribonuclease V